MLLKKLFAIVIFCFAFYTYSFSFTIEVLDEKIISPYTLTLKTFVDGYLINTDSVVVTQQNYKNIKFNTKNYTGFAVLGINNQKNQIGLIISPKEPEMIVKFNIDDFNKGSITFVNSIENILHAKLTEYKTPFEKSINEVIFHQQTHNILDSLYLNKLLEYEQKLDINYNKMNIICDSVFKADTNLYVNLVADFYKTPTSIYAPQLLKFFDNYRALLHYHYFDYIDFSNPLILNHPVLINKINNYFDVYCVNSNISLAEGIDIIMKKASANEQVKTFIFNYLIDLFLSRNNDVEVAYLNEKYSGGCGIQLTADKLKEFSGIVHSQIGATVPDIVAYDSKNNLSSIKNEYQKNKYTVVYVWMSSCSACNTKTPKVAEIVAPYLKKGLGVFSISLDDKKDIWLSSILKYNIDNWTNISELVSLQKSSILSKLNIRTTPKLFIIDNNGKIVNKDIFGTDLDNQLKQLFNTK